MNKMLAMICWMVLLLAGLEVLAQETPAPVPAAPEPPVSEPAPPRDQNPQPASPEPKLVDLAAVPASEPGEEPRAPLALEQELPSAIQFLARMAEINIHFDPSVTFTNLVTGPDGLPTVPIVSIRWENVSARDALEEVLDIHGLMLQENPKTGIARVLKKPTVEPLVTTIVQLKYSNPTNIAELVKTTFADPARSKVNADLRTSQLLLVATEAETEAITNLVTQLDTPTKQVLIEAHLLETSRNPRSIKGIDWAGTLEGQNVTAGNGRTTGATTTRLPGQTVTTTLPSGRTVTRTEDSSSATELLTQLGLGGISGDTVRGFYPSTAFLNADGLRAVLSFLNTDAETEVVATPRQVTADNQTAVLSVTRAFPIFEITPGTAQTPPTAKITYTNLGTLLKVTPRISASSNVLLKVVPEVSSIDSKDRQIIFGDINEANVYAIRRMETEVMIPSGNTLVMGGLISDTSTKGFSKVPLLGDLPGLGLLFRRDTKERTKANLMIFVTPTIVEEKDFQPSQTDFLKTPWLKRPETEESAWDSGKPYRWTQPKP